MNSNIYHSILDYRKEFYNLGDYIQSYAVLSLLKKMGVSRNMFFLNRERLSENLPKIYGNDRDIRVIMNGWFSHSEQFIPNEYLRPLYIGFHLDSYMKKDSIKDKIVGYNNTNIGCRDLSTLSYIGKENGYFSRCLTLLFDEYNGEKTNEILVVGYSGKSDNDDFIKYIPKTILEQSKILYHRNNITLQSTATENLGFTRSRLRRYAKAKLVITNLLHCAMPCVALGTPVVFVNDFCRNIKERRTSVSGILPNIGIKDLTNIDYNSVPKVNISKLKEAMLANFELSYKQAFNASEFNDIGALNDAREEIRSFVSNEYYDFL